ncbi:MAG: adenosylmethionine--8-amino-7-oxononanoate transaminase [Tatlockia sp.]|jgi:adenosylmethionine-8-amino-7-oxononanoate aminotransferase
MMDVIKTDLKHIWHPCAQMKDFQICPPIVVSRAKGNLLYTDKGPLIDAISSWWCKSLGHGHPKVLAAIEKQMQQFEHVIAANTTHEVLARFGEKMRQLSGLSHVFFASDGSSAVEIAMKLALHANQIKGQSERREFIALENSYHGETLATLSVSDLGLYKKPYEGFGVTCHFLKPIPYVSGVDSPLWQNTEAQWQTLLPQLEKVKERACALIVEPLVQGANGMRCYSADFLKKLADFARENNIYLIADEIMTGFGRTGEWFACHHAGVKPDLMCVSKGLTGGTIPLSCVLIDSPIYQLFYADYDTGNSFLHSHTYSANALAVSAALATLEVMEEENINQKVQDLSIFMRNQFEEVAKISGKLSEVRGLGALVAADLCDIKDQRVGFMLYQEALKQGALLRPIGNTLYWLPPLNIDQQTIENLAEITLNSIRAVYKKP